MSFEDAQAQAAANKNRSGGAGAQVQRLGRFMSAMIMPNIGAFVAWGLITALFIETGWLNLGGEGNVAGDSWIARVGGWGEYDGAGIVGPMITFLLPLIIGYMGGRLVYDTRGAVIGAVATTGVIVGSSVPMFLGAMIIGPFAAWCLKKVEATWQGKIKPGFEMLVDNFSLGIIGAAIALLGKFVIGPIVERGVDWAGRGVDVLVDNSLLPLASIVVEPAKILFLNNAINHGVFTPLGADQASTTGKSLLFMIESNPGPGIGILLAFMFFGPKLLKAAAPGAAIIQFFGGIHEVYFPFILAKPKLIAAVILGGMTGVMVGVLFNGGLVGPPSPGSIFAWVIFTPAGVTNYIVMFAQVLLAAAVSFTVAALLLGFGREAKREDQAAEEAQAQAAANAPAA